MMSKQAVITRLALSCFIWLTCPFARNNFPFFHVAGKTLKKIGPTSSFCSKDKAYVAE